MADENGKTIGICLSGGGFRATLFALGSLWRLNDFGLLKKLDRITCVSGGSITGAYLGATWEQLNWDDDFATNFEEVFAQPILSFCNKRFVDGRATISRALPWISGADGLERLYSSSIFSGLTLKNLGGATQRPEVLICGTNMQTGVNFKFSKDGMGDYSLGYYSDDEIPLAKAVAVSSAFPPILSPMIIRTDPKSDKWENHAHTIKDVDLLCKLREKIVLSDGGVYDNLGLEPIFKPSPSPPPVDIVLVADAGSPEEVHIIPWQLFKIPKFWTGNVQLSRVRDIMMHQTRKLRRRHLISDLLGRRVDGAYWGLATEIKDYQSIHGLSSIMAQGNALTRSLATAPTRLTKFDGDIATHLVNWGYALTDSAVRAFPYRSENWEPSEKWPIEVTGDLYN